MGQRGPEESPQLTASRGLERRAEGVSHPLASSGSRPCDCLNQQNTEKYGYMTSEAREIPTVSHPYLRLVLLTLSFLGPATKT